MSHQFNYFGFVCDDFFIPDIYNLTVYLVIKSKAALLLVPVKSYETENVVLLYTLACRYFGIYAGLVYLLRGEIGLPFLIG